MVTISNNQPFYQPYLQFKEVQKGLESGDLIKGTLRINQRNYEETFIENPMGDAFPDILIMGLKDRNRAFHEDVVVVKLNDRSKWIIRDPLAKNNLSTLMMKLSLSESNTPASKCQQNYRSVSEDEKIEENSIQKTGTVVYIKEEKGSRVAVGRLKPMADNKRNWALFSPRDSRIPRMLIPAALLPPGFFERPQDFANFLFVAELYKWPENSKMARANLHQSLGNAGEINAESQALLITSKIDTREFTSEVLSCLPFVEGEKWTIEEDEIKKRKDFRSYTVFTIDPATARDLDDALHIKRIPDCDKNGTPGWEVGVHIADVSFFLQPGTELDKWAQKRATSVYLVEKVIPMLPRVLCEELCSLNPGVDRLTFSVVWKMDDNGKIKDEWIGRSVICSCAKLAYDHAQEIIENPEKKFAESDLPTIFNGKTIQEIAESVINLNTVSSILKKERIAKGSLRLNSTKLRFALASENGMPIGIGGDERKDANFLVEELMLLANMQIAKFIYKKFPETSLLRRHPPPKVKLVANLKDKLDILDCSVEFKTGESIGKSLHNYMTDEHTSLFIYPALINFVLRCMQLAVYFSSGTCENYHHYALNVDFYTHFTSPIRRYPDLIVHRLLGAALGYNSHPGYSAEELEVVCKHCNDQKYKAKAVSDASSEMFFGFFIREIGILKTVGVIINVLDSAFDVFLIKYNIVTRVYTEKLKISPNSHFIKGISPILVINWDAEYAEEVKQARLKIVKEMPKPINHIIEDDLDEKELILDNTPDEKEDIEGHFCVETKQTLRAFTPVTLLLTPIENSTKFTSIIEPTTDEFRLSDDEIRNILSN